MLLPNWMVMECAQTAIWITISKYLGSLQSQQEEEFFEICKNFISKLSSI